MTQKSMDWERLLSTKRFGQEALHRSGEHNRTEFQRDYDRLIFSAPFRRLQNKTQVFPLPGSVFVHNRLTHSLEVASVGRSLGNNVARELKSHKLANNELLDEIGYIVATACLAHDMGNPPFGHSGEQSLSSYFIDGKGKDLKNQVSETEWQDLINFEGNANALRLLTHQFKGRREGGFALTYSTLASIVKYPWDSVQNPGKKYGFFESERETFDRIKEELGLVNHPDGTFKWARHPLVYLVEAADDICYQVMDIEDAHKLRILSYEETCDLLLGFFDPQTEKERLDRVKNTLNSVSDRNEQISYLRSIVIGRLVEQCTSVFIRNHSEILQGTFSGTLIKKMEPFTVAAYKTCSTVAVEKIYKDPKVLEIELAGFKILTELLDDFLTATMNPNNSLSKMLLPRMPQQYHLDEDATIYQKVRGVLDFVSGMTDVYALDLFRKMTGMSIPSV